jgi:lipid A 3-O-deacylase
MSAGPGSAGTLTHRSRTAAIALLALLLPAGAAAQGMGGVLSEAKGGVLAHDVAFLGDGDEEGVDVNAELVFRGVEVWDDVLDVRPHLGASVSTAGDTSQLYAGLTWRVQPIGWRAWAALATGGTIHDGETGELTGRAGRRSAELGSRALFRVALELGYDVTDRLTVSAIWAHASNANLADQNAGLNNAGLRVGWRF